MGRRPSESKRDRPADLGSAPGDLWKSTTRRLPTLSHFRRAGHGFQQRGGKKANMAGKRRSTTSRLVVTVLSGMLSLSFGQAIAQSRSTVRGRVLDPTRAPIPDARITAVREGRASELSAVSDSNGEFSLALDAGQLYSQGHRQRAFWKSSQAVSSRGERRRIARVHPAGCRNSRRGHGERVGGVSVSCHQQRTKTLTPLRDVPQSITVVTQQLIRDQMMMSIGDVVRYVPGITAHQGENNRDQVIIRGNRLSADFFVNGVRDDVQYYRDLYNLDRVEALKGPNAMIFGRGGRGGVSTG